jgi:hypothetical protein
MILTMLNVSLGLGVGAFALSNIVLPFTVTLPILRRLRNEQLLTRDVPAYLVFSAPVIWIILLALVFLGYSHFFPTHVISFAVGFCIALPAPVIGTLHGIRRRDISSDFLQNYGEYLDKEKIARHPLFSETLSSPNKKEG